VSVSLILSPRAIAAIDAVLGTRPARDGTGSVVCEVRTRMRDERLLAAALRETGAAVTSGDGGIAVRWSGVGAAFARDADGDGHRGRRRAPGLRGRAGGSSWMSRASW
jgi:hypothetical protein